MNDSPKYDPIKQEMFDRLNQYPWYDLPNLTWKDLLILESVPVFEEEYLGESLNIDQEDSWAFTIMKQLFFKWRAADKWVQFKSFSEMDSEEVPRLSGK